MMEIEDGCIGSRSDPDDRKVKYVIYPRVSGSRFPKEHLMVAFSDEQLANVLAQLVSRGHVLGQLDIFRVDEHIVGRVEVVVVQIQLADGTELEGTL